MGACVSGCPLGAFGVGQGTLWGPQMGLGVSWGPRMGSGGPGGDGPRNSEVEPKNPPRPEIREQKDEVKLDLVEIQQSYGSA